MINLGIISAVLHACGYWLYKRSMDKENSEPNPTTWFIFSFDVAVLTVLEWFAGASWEDLYLPMVCTMGAVMIAVSLLKHNKISWLSADKNDKLVLMIAMVVVILYSGVWLLSEVGTVSENVKYKATILFLLLSNANTFVGFWPTLKNARNENPIPWFVWTIAYTLLLLVLISRKETSLILYIYPVSSIFLHGLVGVLAVAPFRKRLPELLKKARRRLNRNKIKGFWYKYSPYLNVFF